MLLLRRRHRMSRGMSRLSEVARHVVTPEGVVSTGWPAVRETCSRMGLEFDPWQDGLGRLILGKRADGGFAADIFAMSVPRQSGKTHLLGGMVFAMCIQQKTTVIWTAHRTRTAAETFKSMQGFAVREKVAPHVLNIVRGAGTEAVEFVNGSRILFGARERGFGRGFAGIDVLIFDEAQILSENAMDDMVPATNAARNPLVVMAGTPPKPNDPGEVFTVLRQEALAGESTDVGYVEISADRGCDPLDREQWRKMNPSFPKRTSERAILRMFKVLSEDSFRREAQGIWDEVSVHKPLVSVQQWRDMADVGPADDVKPDALGLDMSHGRAISVAGCWVEGEDAHIEQVWAGSDAAQAVEWVAARARRTVTVVVDGASPAASLVPELKARSCRVVVTSAANMAQACGMLENRIAAESLTHGAQPQLTEAIMGARRRPIRDAGGWALDRSDPTSQIYPIVAATLALFGASSSRRRPSAGVSSRRVRVLS